MTDIYMADISEFQSNIDAPTYLGARQCVICRAHNGNRPDNMMPVRRNYLRGYPFVAIGWYQYLVANRDPAAQANDFVATVGALMANEYPVLDLEEGGGDQSGRAQAWFNVVDVWAGFPATLYSGDSFFRTQLGGTARWAGRPCWVAAYGQSEPTQPHTLWQYTSSANVPGVTGACDDSVHHGSPQEYLSSVRAGHLIPTPTPPTPPPEDEKQMIIAGMVNGQGYIAVKPDGSVHAYGTAGYHGGANLGGDPNDKNKTDLSAGDTVTDAAIMGDGSGYWLIAKSGAVFAYGNARYAGGPNT